MDNRLSVTMDTGEQAIISVIDIITDTETNVEYIIYNILGSEDVYASILLENDTMFMLKTIDNDQERELINQYLNTEMGNIK